MKKMLLFALLLFLFGCQKNDHSITIVDRTVNVNLNYSVSNGVDLIQLNPNQLLNGQQIDYLGPEISIKVTGNNFSNISHYHNIIIGEVIYVNKFGI